jgi:hypothetical protein
MNQTIVEYAVRIKGTQCYMVRSQRRDGRGGSHLEPMDMTRPETWPTRYAQGMMIRTFATKNAAGNLMRSWVQGKHYGDWDSNTFLTKVPERNIENLEVVEIVLHLPN